MGDIKSLLKSIGDWLKEGTKEAVKEAKELKEEGEKKVKKVAISNKIKDRMTKLGDRVYYLMKNRKRITSDKEVKKLYNEILKLEEEMQKLEKEGTSKKPRRTKTTRKKRESKK